MLIFVILILIMSCGRSSQEIFQEMKSLEYLRHAEPEKFINWLNDRNTRIREKAIEALGRIQDTTTIPWVANRLLDENNKVRVKAAFALGQFFNSKAEELALTALRNEKNKDVQTRLIEVLGKVGTSRSFNTLEHYLNTDKDYTNTTAIACGIIAYRGIPPYNIAQMLMAQFKTEQNPETHWRIAYAIYRMNSPIGFKSLVDTVNNVDPMTRFFLLRLQANITKMMKNPQFGNIKSEQSIREAVETVKSKYFLDSLISALKDTFWFNRVAALQVLENITPASAYENVKQVTFDEHPHVRSMAVQTLSKYRNKKSINFLRNQLEISKDWQLRGFILVSLADLDPRNALRIIEKELDQLKWPQNYFHISALNLIKSQRSSELLKNLTQTDNMAQLSTVLEALAGRDNVPTSLFLEKLELKDPVISTIVAQIMGVLKNEEAIMPLMNNYKFFNAPRDLEAMLQIISTLDSIGSSKSIDFLESQLDNQVISIRKASARALNNITNKTYQIKEWPIVPLTKFDFPEINQDSKPVVKFHTNKGDFEIVLFPGKAPVTVANFINLINSGFYNGVYFHRVVPGFVCQTGDPRGDGWGNPGYAIPCEYNDIFYDRGVVGMAHAGKDTGGSQFFITHTPQPHLNGRHTAFGKVISGMNVVDRIQIFDQISVALVVN